MKANNLISAPDKTDLLFMALKSAVNKELELKKRLDQKVIVFRDGQVLEVSAEEALDSTSSEAESC